jgi:uncharacterized protein YggE
MKTVNWMAVAVASAVACAALAGPELSGTPDELAAHLNSIPGQVTLTGTAELKIEADKAEVVLGVRTSDRSFKAALVKNQQMRADIMALMETNGIPAKRIRMSRFSSTPTQGFFTSKVKSYEVESRVTVEAASEKEVQAVAAIVDEKEGVSLQSLSFSDTRKDDHAAKAVSLALAKVRSQKSIYERSLDVVLIPRAVGPQPGVFSPVVRRAYAAKDMASAPRCESLALQAPDISQFDQLVYNVTVVVTFDVRGKKKPAPVPVVPPVDQPAAGVPVRQP